MQEKSDKKTRNAIRTRQLLLEKGFIEIYLNGFQATSIDKILKNTDITKGAFFHHFKNKLDFGYAILDEFIKQDIINRWQKPLSNTDNVIETILEAYLDGIKRSENQKIILGCPLNNLALEMSPIDQGFQTRIQEIFDIWKKSIADAIQKAIEKGIIGDDVNPVETAFFIISQIEGNISLVKSSQNRQDLYIGYESLKSYLYRLLV